MQERVYIVFQQHGRELADVHHTFLGNIEFRA